MKNWWQIEKEEVVQVLASDLTSGLSTEETTNRLKKYGHNQLKEKKIRSPIRIFFEQFENFIVWVLIGAALVSGFLGEWIDAVAIVAIVTLNSVLGFIQEYRAEKALEGLKKLSSPFSKVIRKSKHEIVPSLNLVPGDLIEIEAGDHIPADSRVVYMTQNFSTQEASLTGESNPTIKTTAVLDKETALADRKNMLYLGTSVSSGKARAIIVETGMNTELGKIAEMIQQVERQSTPLQKKLAQFGKFVVYFCFVLVSIVFLLGFLRGGNLFDLFLTSVSLAVAAIPEGLPAVVTVVLALGVQKMVKRNALIRKLPAIETLGCSTVICSDKTGTLTKNEMTVQAIFTNNTLFKVTGIGYEPRGEFLLNEEAINLADYPDLKNVLVCGSLSNGAELIKKDNSYKIIGDPTEGSLLVCAAKSGLWKDKLEEKFPFVEEIPFDSIRKKMTIIRKDKNKLVAFVKGAPDVMIDNCTEIETNGRRRKITRADKQNILDVNSELAHQAMRILAVSYRELDTSVTNYDPESIEKNLVFLGLMAMVDPPREEVKKAVAECKTAGIRTVMITGDHKQTAVAIAQKLGFFKNDIRALTGTELDKLSDEAFKEEVTKTAVYARVSPEHKLRIVRALREQNEIVAMTGDGVNDAPAVKEADIGIAMGITGTDVTKEVSDMVITDDNFASIVAAIREGRGVYDNIKKFIRYLLSCNMGEICVMFVSSLIGLPIPLLPIHILWVNVVTDGFPAFALGVDPIDPHIMQRSPRSKDEAVVTKQGALLILQQGSFIALCSFLSFVFVLYVEKASIERARTVAFIVLACAQLFHAFNCRSKTQSIFKLGLFTNKKIIYAALISFLLQIVVVHIPFFQKVFKTEALAFSDWLLIVLISSFPLWAVEIVKLFKRKRKLCSI